VEGIRTIGIIAGNGVYPETFVRAARKSGEVVRLVMAAIEEETEAEAAGMADVVAWLRVGQLGKMLKFFRAQGVTEAVMVGQVTPKKLFSLRPDLRTLMLLARLRERNAESLFGGIAGELAKEGILLLPATTFLEDLLPPVGHVCGPPLARRGMDDARFGFRIAKESSRLDIGQSIVVRHGTVLAVEAFEGTNACIKRGGELGRGKNVTLVKVSKPNQDFRFDVPVIGPHTIEACAQAGVGSIAIEAGCTLLLGRDEVLRLCDAHRVSITALAAAEVLDDAACC
jgi:DUF1009 family protein